MATTTDNHKLIVSLEARLRSYEKAIEKAQKDTNQRMRGIETALKRPQKEMDRVGQAAQRLEQRMGRMSKSFGADAFAGLRAGAMAALAPILSVSAALGTARRALADFSKTGDVAQRLGVDVERLQELRFAAEQSGMAVDNFDVAFRRFIRRSAEAAQGGGAAKGAFEELGISLRDSNGRLKDSDKLLGEVADALQKVENPADKLRLAFKMFDTDGASMVNVLSRGSAGLDEFAQKARELGVVVDRQLIAKSQEMAQQLETATTVVDLQFKQALIDLAPVLIRTAELAARLASGISGLVDSMKAVGDRSMRNLQTRRDELRDLLDKPGWQQSGIFAMRRSSGLPVQNADEARAEIDRINQELVKRWVDSNRARLTGEAKPTVLPTIDVSDTDTGGGGRAGSRNAAAEAAIREAEAVRKLIADLEAERAQVGMSSTEKRIATTLRQANVDAASEEGKQIAALIRQIEAETEALKRNEEAQKARTQALENLFEMGGDALVSIADGSLKAEDALKRLIVQLALAAAQAALLGSGPLAGFFGGGLFGGRAPEMAGSVLGFIRHGGTSNMQPGGAGRMVPASTFAGAPRFHTGLKGNEIAAILERGEAVLTQRQANRTAGFMQAATASMKSGGGGYVDNRRINIDARGAQQGVGAEIAEALRQYDREVLPERVNQIANDPHARG